MFSNAFKTLITKLLLTKSLFRSVFRAVITLFQSVFRAVKILFQSPLLQRFFSHQERSSPSTSSLNKYMTKIYRTTGLSIAGSLGLSYILSKTAVAMNPLTAVLRGLAMCIGGIIGLSAIKPQIKLKEVDNNPTAAEWVNPPSRQFAFLSILGGCGILLAPFIKSICMINPSIIPIAAGLSICTMGGASLYAMYKPLGHFKTWESTLYSALIGLISMQVVSLITFAAIGPNLFSLACSKVEMYAGLVLFTAYQAMDTQTAVEAYKEGNYDYLMHVVNFFLNFKNIFVRLASIIGESGSDSAESVESVESVEPAETVE